MLRAYLELLRPPNVATALADVLAGFGVAGLQNRGALPWLLASTACLYAGGVVLNDVFDRDVDRRERPERPIPSGRIPVAHAAALGGGLLAAGVACAAAGTSGAGLVALAIAAAVLLYDAIGKRHALIAPLNMGLCRGLNLLLGVAAVPPAIEGAWPIAIVPTIYIAAITTLSRGEVHGGSRGPATAALAAIAGVWAALLTLAGRAGTFALGALFLALVFGVRVIPPFWNAWRTPSPQAIRTAVVRAILSLVILDAAIAAAYAGPFFAATVLATGVAAGWLARLFAVT